MSTAPWRRAALLGAASFVLSTLPAFATPVITPGGVSTVLNNGTAPGSASDYTFFGNNNQPTHLTNFTVSTAGDSVYPGNANYTNVTAPGGTSAFETGIVYSGSTHLLATFTTTQNAFDVYVLDGNTDGINVGNTSVGLSADGGAQVTQSSKYYSGTNEFILYIVTGATAGDTFQLYANGVGGNYASIGGLTFGAATSTPAATPEPGSLALLGTGLLGVAGVIRRRLAR